jgi:hypothetical protein
VAGEHEDRKSRGDVVIGVLMALVAITAALAAWRTSMVAGDVSSADREGLIAEAKQQAVLHVIEGDVYGQAGYAMQMAMAKAEADALSATGRPASVARAANIDQFLVPSIGQLAGPFAADATTTTAPLPVADQLASARSADPDFQADDPSASFAISDTAAQQKERLTVISVIIALALFWLGMAEITRGGWRLTNGIVGVLLWVIGLVGFVLVGVLASSGAGS